MTNAEKLAKKLAKDTEILAYYLADSIVCSECPATVCNIDDDCVTALKKWLESEVEDESTKDNND